MAKANQQHQQRLATWDKRLSVYADCLVALRPLVDMFADHAHVKGEPTFAGDRDKALSLLAVVELIGSPSVEEEASKLRRFWVSDWSHDDDSEEIPIQWAYNLLVRAMRRELGVGPSSSELRVRSWSASGTPDPES
jgi:hypothetical protein